VSDDEPGRPLDIVHSDAYYRRRGRKGDRRDRELIALFVVVTVIFFAGFVLLFVYGPVPRP
jgi:hypothetical protein